MAFSITKKFHKHWYAIFSYSFITICFFKNFHEASTLTHEFPIYVWYCLISKCLEIFLLSILILWFVFYMVGEHSLYYLFFLNLLTFVLWPWYGIFQNMIYHPWKKELDSGVAEQNLSDSGSNANNHSHHMCTPLNAWGLLYHFPPRYILF